MLASWPRLGAGHCLGLDSSGYRLRRGNPWERPGPLLFVCLLLAGLSGKEGLCADLGELLGGPRRQQCRLSVSAGYRPLETAQDIDRAEKLIEAVVRLEAPSTGPEGQRLHQLGILLLELNSLEDAWSALQDAQRRTPATAPLLNDLACALWVRAQSQDRAETWFEAVELLDRASRLEPSHPGVLFNRALLLQELGWMREAGRAWQNYLQVDDHPGWHAEAKERLESIEDPYQKWRQTEEHLFRLARQGDWPAVKGIADRNPEMCRILAEEKLLAQWASSPDSASAKFALDLMESIAGGVRERSGDPFLEKLADSIRKLRIDRASRPFYALKSFLDGHRLFQRQRYADALAAFEAASQQVPASAPLRQLSDYYYAVCLYQNDLGQQAQILLQSVIERIGSQGFHSLLSRLYSALALVEGHPESYQRWKTEALRLAEEAGESSWAGKLHQDLAGPLYHMGSFEEAWMHTRRALAAVVRSAIPRHRSIIYAAAALWASRRGWPAAALHAQQEAFLSALHYESQAMLARTTLLLARILQSRSDSLEAEILLEEIDQQIALIPTRNNRRWVSHSLYAVRAQVLSSQQPQEALDAIDEAIRLVGDRTDHLNLLRYYRLKASLHSALGVHQEALDAILAAVGHSEKVGLQLDNPELRVQQAQNARQLYQQALQTARDASTDAALLLDLAERSRPRLTPPRPVSGTPRQRIDDLTSRLPPETLVLAYHLLPDRLMAWALRPGSEVAFHEADAPRDELKRLTATLSSCVRLRCPAAEVRPQLERLWRLLLEPFEDRLHPNRTLVVVPSGILWQVPFAALVHPERGSYLVESVQLATALSVSQAVSGLVRLQQESEPPRCVLSLGNPTVDADLASQLPALPGALQEAKRVRELYSCGELATGAEATSDLLLRKTPHVDVIHVAAHARTDTNDPWSSFLALAPSEDRNGRINARSLLKLHLKRLRLAVLSACEAAPRGDAPSLAEAFLASGTSTVIASLLPIEDGLAQEWLVPFHRYFREGISALGSIHQVQIRTAQQSGTIAWATIVALIG